MTAICIASSLFFLLLRQPLPQRLAYRDPTIGNSNSSALSQQSDAQTSSVKADIHETWKLLISVRMLKLAPLIIWTAVSNSINSSVLIPMMTDSIPN